MRVFVPLAVDVDEQSWIETTGLTKSDGSRPGPNAVRKDVREFVRNLLQLECSTLRDAGATVTLTD
jgi:hypothetical protein